MLFSMVIELGYNNYETINYISNLFKRKLRCELKIK